MMRALFQEAKRQDCEDGHVPLSSVMVKAAPQKDLHSVVLIEACLL
jgi:hypothetical protein